MSERYLADENFPAAAVRLLRNRGDACYSRPRAWPVRTIWRLSVASEQDRVLLTFDQDFGELVVRPRLAPPGVVLFRLRQQPPAVVLPFLRMLFEAGPSLRGFFTVASPGQFRQRRLN